MHRSLFDRSIPRILNCPREIGVADTHTFLSDVMDRQPQNLQALFASAKAQKEALENDSPVNNPQYQDKLDATISAFENCLKLVSNLALFSSNESLEDVSTTDLKCETPRLPDVILQLLMSLPL